MIDLRSDTVTRPSAAMRAAMASAEVGDDVFGEDPTVNALQQRCAELLAKEAALFVPTGTQSNLCALLAHCERGDEYIAGNNAHCYRYEGGGAAVLGSIQPQPVPFGDDGMIDLAAAEAAIKPDDAHFAKTRLICLENTHDGKAIEAHNTDAFHEFAKRHRLSTHLDGARIWNASVELGLSPAELAAGFDTVSVCLSKGLGTPAGSVLVGSAELIDKAHRWRKLLGGGMRQSGMLAAAGLFALDHNIERLAADHALAKRLADALGKLPRVEVLWQATNMVFARFDAPDEVIDAALRERQVAALVRGGVARFVTHLDLSADDISVAIEALRDALMANA